MPRSLPRVLIEVRYPMWFRAFYGVCAAGTVVICVRVVAVGIGGHGRGINGAIALTAALLAIVLYGVRIVFRSLVATEDGLEMSVIGSAPARISWADIQAVRRPTFGIPQDAAYIVSHSGRRLMIARSMSGVPELLTLIERKAPRLQVVAAGIAPSTSWKPFIIALAVVAAYTVVRMILK
jgi:hypothetical protein